MPLRHRTLQIRHARVRGQRFFPDGLPRRKRYNHGTGPHSTDAAAGPPPGMAFSSRGARHPGLTIEPSRRIETPGASPWTAGRWAIPVATPLLPRRIETPGASPWTVGHWAIPVATPLSPTSPVTGHPESRSHPDQLLSWPANAGTMGARQRGSAAGLGGIARRGGTRTHRPLASARGFLGIPWLAPGVLMK